MPFRHVGQTGNFTQFLTPVCAQIEMFDRAAIALRLIITDETVMQCFTRHDLQLRIKRCAHRKPAFKQRSIAVTGYNLTTHFFSKIFTGKQTAIRIMRLHAQRCFFGFFCILNRNIAVFLHTIDHPVAAFNRGIVMAFGIVVVWPLW